MNEAFDTLKRERKTDVDSLIHWMKDAQIIDDRKVTDDKVRSLLDGVSDTEDVDLANFMEALAKLAEEQAVPLDDYVKALVDAVHEKSNISIGSSHISIHIDTSCPRLIHGCCKRSTQ